VAPSGSNARGVVVAAVSGEAQQLARTKAADVAALSWEELDAYGKQGLFTDHA
jgi:hypothetical protein